MSNVEKPLVTSVTIVLPKNEIHRKSESKHDDNNPN